MNVAQPITFESMRVAREFADPESQVELYAAWFPEDEPAIPPHCKKLPPLDRSILDFHTFGQPRKLPLIQDILDRLYDATDAEYLIYTHVDITLMPHFYSALTKLFESGADALSITRRTIRAEYSSASELPLMYAELGEQHPGHDCFVFRRGTYRKFDLGRACIGLRLFARIVLLNIIVYAKKFEIHSDLHMTFHLGDDRAWMGDTFADYTEFQRNEMRTLLRKYHAEGKLKDDPFIIRQIKRNAPDLGHKRRRGPVDC